MVLMPEPIIPAIRASIKYFENKLGMKELKKLNIGGRIEYMNIPPINPKIPNIKIMNDLFID